MQILYEFCEIYIIFKKIQVHLQVLLLFKNIGYSVFKVLLGI
jgi:hypothetical protein